MNMPATIILWARYVLRDLYTSYILNEITHVLFTVWVFTQAEWPLIGSSRLWIEKIPGSSALEPFGHGEVSRFAAAFVLYWIAYGAVAVSLLALVVARRKDPSSCRDTP